jgi:hypothetical protein
MFLSSPREASVRPILAAYQNFSPFFYFIAKMAKNRVLVSLEPSSLPNNSIFISFFTISVY